jgi:hypothetical protein
MVPTRVYHFPSFLCPPCPICSPFSTCAILSFSLPFFPVLSPTCTTIFLIRCPPVPTIFPVSVPTPAPTHVLCSAAAVLPVHPGLQAGVIPFFPVLAPTRTIQFSIFNAHPCLLFSLSRCPPLRRHMFSVLQPPYYPYTLDYRLEHDCMIPPCPTRSFPGSHNKNK